MTSKSTADGPRGPALPHQGGIRRALLFVPGAIVLAVGAYASAGFFGGPWLVDRWLAGFQADGADRAVSREAIRFNPFTLIAEITALEIADDEAGAAFAVDRLLVDFAVESLTERRPVVSSIVAERPRLAVLSLGQLSALTRQTHVLALDRTRIDHLELTGGTLAIGAGTGEPVRFLRLALSLTRFDGRSGTDGRFTLETVTAGDTVIEGEGRLAENLESAEGQLRLAAIDPGTVANSLGGMVGAVEPRGRFDLTAAFSATALLTAPRLELSDARLEFSELALTPTEGLTVTSDPAEAAGRLALTTTDEGTGLGGRLEAEGLELAIRDLLMTPPQTFALDDTAVLVTMNADEDGVSLSLAGRLNGAGEATVTARVPPDERDARRVTIAAKNVPARMLSPYAQQILGRPLATGYADLELDYERNADRLDGSLRLVTRALAFSEPAEDDTPAFGGPPLELAAALLENADGLIEIELPFASNTGRVRGAVAAALEARIASVTDTPFDTLTALIGDLADAVPFLPGDAALNDRALAAIGRLAEALDARPKLGLRVHGGFEPEVDRNALARQQIELHVQLATAGPGREARSAPVDFESALVRDVLDEFAGERLPAARVAELGDRYACEGALAAVCERAYYESIFDALVASEEITQTALNRLGRFRALSVIDALGERGIADDRLELVTGGAVVDTPFGIGLPVELTATRGR